VSVVAAGGLLPRGCIKPATVVIKNAQGAGGSLLVECITHPAHGPVSNTAMPEKDSEMDKVLGAAAIKGSPVIIFDT